MEVFLGKPSRLYPENLNSYKEFRSKLYSDNANDFLTKLLPIVAKDGFSSNTHKDIRVFDFNLSEKIDNNIIEPKRWIRIKRHD